MVNADCEVANAECEKREKRHASREATERDGQMDGLTDKYPSGTNGRAAFLTCRSVAYAGMSK